MNEKQGESFETALWVAIRSLEERRNLLKNIADHENEAGHTTESLASAKKAEEMATHIERLKAVLYGVDKQADETAL